MNDLTPRIEKAEVRAQRSRECADSSRDEALGAAEAGLEGDREQALRMVGLHAASVELHQGTAQALRNELRARGYAVRRAAAS